MSVSKYKRQRRAQDALRAEAYDEHLRSAKKNVVDDSETIRKAADYVMSGFQEYVVRSISTFRPIKTKDRGRLRTAAAQHIFGVYPTPKHVQDIWSADIQNRHRDYQFHFEYGRDPNVGPWGNDPRNNNLPHYELEEKGRKRLYIVVATGGSLYKTLTKDFLTKKETHAFLTCPLRLTFTEALVFAIGKSYTDDVGILNRLAKSNLNTIGALVSTRRENVRPGSTEFWKDVVRFLAQNPQLSIQQVNDLLDFLKNNRGEIEDYSLKGRTVESLMGQMAQWHRDLGRVKRMGNRSWNGVSLSDRLFEGKKDREVNWTSENWLFTQIKTSKALADEGNKMHHCVYSYQSYCISGARSIWSLRRNDERAITIEVNNHEGMIVQIRGYANRQARPEERKAIAVWAAESGLRTSSYA